MPTLTILPDGTAVDEATGKRIGAQPTRFHHYDYGSGTWRDARTDAQKEADALAAIDTLRRTHYPPLADLADALFWQANKDSGPMDAYLAAVAAVKAKYPKPKGQ